MARDEEDDPRVIAAEKKLKEAKEAVAKEKWAKGEAKQRTEDERDRRLALEMLTKRMRQEAQETISLALEATRTSVHYEEPGLRSRGEFADNFPSSQKSLELEMLPILEKVLAEELKKRLGKKPSEEVLSAMALAFLLVSEHQDWE